MEFPAWNHCPPDCLLPRLPACLTGCVRARAHGLQAGPPSGQSTESGLSIVSGDEEAQQVLDWKGDPMTINPGDKMPFKFQ